MDEEKVFKALADASRRKLLDALFQRDGQTLGELETQLPMSRFGTMKHLQLLEDAGLITTRKIGREKFHYLNPVPIQQVYERWVSKYAAPWTHTLIHLKSALEGHTMSATTTHVFEVYIRTSPEKLWQALTDGSLTAQYYFNTAVQSAWTVGAPYYYNYANGQPMIEGEILEIEPPKRLVTTFKPLWTDAAQPFTKVSWEIEAKGDACKLTLTHEGLDAAAGLTRGLFSGWSQILSGLKTLLETGYVLVVTEPETTQA
jgi:uncharacterized protein YndB with AHSA1/START domain